MSPLAPTQSSPNVEHERARLQTIAYYAVFTAYACSTRNGSTVLSVVHSSACSSTLILSAGERLAVTELLALLVGAVWLLPAITSTMPHNRQTTAVVGAAGVVAGYVLGR
jgi:hypothetical protein